MPMTKEQIFQEGWNHRRMDVVQALVDFAGSQLSAKTDDSVSTCRVDAAPERLPVPHYLEIGCRDDETFANITRVLKIGVDPIQGGTVRMTSDQFFASYPQRFDVIFIDGDHSFRQSLIDAENAVPCLEDGGILAMHDVCPRQAYLTGEGYSGEVWRTFLTIRMQADLDAVLLDMRDDPVGFGVVLKRPNSRPIVGPPNPVTVPYEEMLRNLDAWMRPSTPEQVIEFLTRSP